MHCLMASSDDLQDWTHSLRTLLSELALQTAGFPFGANEVRNPVRDIARLPADLHILYTLCDGLSCPDVHVGYFLDTSSRVVSATERGEPTRIDSAPGRVIHVFGSDGGGGRFAVSPDDHGVYYLPSSGGVTNGLYFPDGAAPVRFVAPSISQFLMILKRDVEAFVRGIKEHAYIAR